MADIRALEAVAELLPPERRERFYKIAAKFQHIPEEDDHLQLLEATGFMMMAIHAVPERMAGLVAELREGMSGEEISALRHNLRELTANTAALPDFASLRQAAADLRDSGTAIGRQVDAIGETMRGYETVATRRATVLACAAAAILAGILGSLFAALLPEPWKAAGVTLPDGRDKLALATANPVLKELLDAEILDFEITETSDLGKVAVLTVKGRLIHSQTNGEQTKVLLAPPTERRGK
ncbi:MAG: hypothetical protein R3F11_20790 [Verrucomicrobiales bacterium]